MFLDFFCNRVKNVRTGDGGGGGGVPIGWSDLAGDKGGLGGVVGSMFQSDLAGDEGGLGGRHGG